MIQKSGDEDDHNIDMSNHHSVPPTTDTDGDIAMPDNEDSNPEVNHWSNSQQQSSKQSVRRQKAFLAEVSTIQFLSGNLFSVHSFYILETNHQEECQREHEEREEARVRVDISIIKYRVPVASTC